MRNKIGSAILLIVCMLFFLHALCPKILGDLFQSKNETQVSYITNSTTHNSTNEPPALCPDPVAASNTPVTAPTDEASSTSSEDEDSVSKSIAWAQKKEKCALVIEVDPTELEKLPHQYFTDALGEKDDTSWNSQPLDANVNTKSCENSELSCEPTKFVIPLPCRNIRRSINLALDERIPTESITMYLKVDGVKSSLVYTSMYPQTIEAENGDNKQILYQYESIIQ